VTPGNYNVAFADPTGNYITQWFNGTAAGAADQGSASTVAIAAGTNPAMNATLVPVVQVGTVTGTITSASTGSPVGVDCAYLYPHGNSAAASYATCARADGTFELDGVAAGSYDVAYFDPSGTYATQWFNGTAGGASSQSGATPITVTNAATTSGVNAAVSAVNQSGNLIGTVTDSSSHGPIAGACVYLYQPGNSSSASYATCTQSDGTYGVYGVPSGSYDVAFTDPSGGHVTQWFNGTAAGSSTQGGATTVSVPDAGANSAPTNAALVAVGTGNVSGTVTAAAGGANLGNVCVYLYQVGNSSSASYATCTQADGSYTLSGVAAGSYDVAFYDPTGTYATQWSTGTVGGSATQGSATAITVNNGNRTTTGIGAAMAKVN
jgi:hypothetical protein